MGTKLYDLQEAVQEFQDQGYIVLKNVLDAGRVAALNAAIDEIIAREPESPSYSLYNCVTRHPEIAALIDQPDILPLMVNLLGYNIQLHISHLTVKKPQSRDTKGSFIDWHEDGPAPKIAKVQGLAPLFYIKACYILSDMSEPGRGNTKVVPGSHRIPNYQPAYTDVRVPLDGEVEICGQPGDVFIFAQNLWHAGSHNYSDYTRRQLFMGYSPLWVRPIDYHRAPDELLQGASPYRRQLLGDISDNCFKFYVPEESMVPLKELYRGPGTTGSYPG